MPAMTSELLEEHYDGARPVRTLVHLFAGQRWRIALAALAFALKHSPVWIMPLLTAEVIDIVVQHRPLRDLWWSAILMAVFIAQNYPLTWVYTRQLSVSVRTVETNLRMALARRLQELSIGYHRRISAGVLQAKIVRDVENVVESTRQTFDSGMAAITTLAGAGKALVSDVAGAVRFVHVGFAYDDAPDEHAIEDFSLDVVPGETVALVGPSGSGKSTVLNLVIGFLAPTTGQILLDGRDVTGLDLRSYRRHLAVVPQESLLFEGSVRANVTYGSPELTDDAVRVALRDANALDFVEQMGGLDAVIGERGARLSGGQRQRIAIARALVRDPRVLVLDEATSALDTASERLVQEALARLMRGRTTFVVAHRLSTIQGADRIAVMRAGRLVEIGSHAELMAADGAYAALQGQGAQPR
jgi:ABC-type multidrug transport system fused ATPase/permease subunit